MSTTAENVPHVSDDDRVELDHLGDPYDAITHLTLRFGFQEDQDVPAALAVARDRGIVEVDPDTAYYFLSRISVQRGSGREMSRWRKRLFLGPGAQRRLADRVLPAPRGPDRRHGCQRRPLASAARGRLEPSTAWWRPAMMETCAESCWISTASSTSATSPYPVPPGSSTGSRAKASPTAT